MCHYKGSPKASILRASQNSVRVRDLEGNLEDVTLLNPVGGSSRHMLGSQVWTPV